MGDCLVADVQICFQEFLIWRHDRTVRFAQHAMEEGKIGCTVAWLLAASSSGSPHNHKKRLRLAYRCRRLGSKLGRRAFQSTWETVSVASARSNLIVPSDDAHRGTAQWLKASYAECTRDGPISPPLSPSTAQPRHRRQTPDEPARPSTAALSAHDGRLHRTAAAKGAQRPLP